MKNIFNKLDNNKVLKNNTTLSHKKLVFNNTKTFNAI